MCPYLSGSGVRSQHAQQEGREVRDGRAVDRNIPAGEDALCYAAEKLELCE